MARSAFRCGGARAGEFTRGRRHVVGERRGLDIAERVVDDFFEQRVADALRDAAVDLAVGDQRIDDAAGIFGREDIFAIVTRPVAISTSTMAAWQALEKVPGGS